MSSSSSRGKKPVLMLKSSDGEVFEVEEAVAIQCKTLKNMVEDGCSSGVIPIPNVHSTMLAKVIEFCRRHVVEDERSRKGKAKVDAYDDEDEEAKAKAELEKERLRAFDEDFLSIDRDTLFYLFLAANYLNAERLLNTIAKKVADMLKGKNPDEMRQVLGIKSDFTPEEEEAMREEMPYAFLC